MPCSLVNAMPLYYDAALRHTPLRRRWAAMTCINAAYFDCPRRDARRPIRADRISTRFTGRYFVARRSGRRRRAIYAVTSPRAPAADCRRASPSNTISLSAGRACTTTSHRELTSALSGVPTLHAGETDFLCCVSAYRRFRMSDFATPVR